MLKTLLLVSALVALMTACATQTPYKIADKRGAPGYTETMLTDTRYRVTFTGNSTTPAETVKDYALLRAAELTLEKGYEWFQLADRDSDKKVRSSTSVSSGIDIPSQTSVYQRCGMFSCDTVVSSSPGFSSGVDVGTTTTSTAYSSSLEIIVGKKPMPQNDESYDARQLSTTLRRLMNSTDEG